MFYKMTLLALFSFGFGAIINVPGNYPTIQEAIDVANPGDEILVDDGTYTENLLIEKDILLNSVNGADLTIIDGSNGRSLGSTIITRPISNTTHLPIIEIDGFSIINGSGTNMKKEVYANKGSEIIDLIVGGGVLVYNCSPKLNNNKFLNNGNNITDKGGAIFASSNSDDIGFYDREDYEIHPDLAPATEPLDFSNNFYLNNASDYGASIFISGFNESIINLQDGHFDVFSEENMMASDYWVFGLESAFDFERSTGELPAITNDVWVDPENGMDESNIIGDEENPFLTIGYALSVILSTEENSITINLVEGTYSPSINNESFPIIFNSNISLIGQEKYFTIIDAEETGGVISIQYCNNVSLSNLTITGGNSIENWSTNYGGGISIYNSNPNLSQLIVTNNTANIGGGIWLFEANPTIEHILIGNNIAVEDGGGIYLSSSNPIINHTSISNNVAGDQGGGIRSILSSMPEFTNVEISNNLADYGGGLSSTNSEPKLKDALIAFNLAFEGGGGLQLKSSNAIITNVDIYGNTAKDGGGIFIYSSANPILTHVVISHNWATNCGGGIYASFSSPVLMDITLSENWAWYGGGIYLLESSYSSFANLLLNHNTATKYGGAIYLKNSNLFITHATLFDNLAAEHGSGIYYNSSNLELTNSIFWNNSQELIHSTTNDLPIINFSDVEGGWVSGEGNIDIDPLFENPFEADFTLSPESPCVNTGNANPWYNDIDMSISDMGFTGGTFLLAEFLSFDFGDVGNIGISTNWNIYNYRPDTLWIENVNFNTTTFSTESDFPILVEPHGMSQINIECFPDTIGIINDSMFISSPNIMEGAFVKLKVNGMDEHVISGGNISGTIESAIYRINGNINVLRNDSLTILPGTEFLFDGPYSFSIEGMLTAKGTKEDSIIFDNYYGVNPDERWKGITLDSTQTTPVFEYVRISHAWKKQGGGLYLYKGSLKMNHAIISGNFADNGGGIWMRKSNNSNSASNTLISDVLINHNQAFQLGGGIYIWSSDPILSNVIVSNNNAETGGGIFTTHYANPMIKNVIINDNYASSHGGGMFLTGNNSNPILINTTISNNIADHGGGLYMNNSTNLSIINSIIWTNNSMLEGNINNALFSNIFLEDNFIYEGESNINNDPIFTNSSIGDYTLQLNSPCIDAGTDFFVWEDDTLVNMSPEEYYGTAPDMGAFEWYPEESEFQPGDVTQDGSVNVHDIILLLGFILMIDAPDSNEFELANLNTDGQLNVLDVVMLVEMILGV